MTHLFEKVGGSLCGGGESRVRARPDKSYFRNSKKFFKIPPQAGRKWQLATSLWTLACVFRGELSHRHKRRSLRAGFDGSDRGIDRDQMIAGLSTGCGG